MSKRAKPKADKEHQVVDLVMRLIHELRSTRRINYSEFGRLYSENIDYPELSVERELFQQVISILLTANPEISRRLIISSLIIGVVGVVVFNYDNPISDDKSAEMASEKIKGLLNYSSTREIDIPIVSLNIDGPPVRIGKITFHSITEVDRNSEWWQKVTLNFAGNSEAEVLTFGRIACPGDWEIALDYAETSVHETLQVLRGIGFPFFSEDVSQFGVINEYPVWPNRPFRFHEPEETVRIEYSSNVVTRLGPPIRVWRLYDDLLKAVEDNVIEVINNLLSSDKDSVLTEMERKFISGLRWLGEATKPDELPARYLKLSTALEFLIGGESGDERLAGRGITATLAERAAFLIGSDQDQRLSIDKKVGEYYGLRSRIVHGGRDEIEGTDFVEFGLMIRQIAFALCKKLSSFKNIYDLQVWVKQIRYSSDQD